MEPEENLRKSSKRTSPQTTSRQARDVKREKRVLSAIKSKGVSTKSPRGDRCPMKPDGTLIPPLPAIQVDIKPTVVQKGKTSPVITKHSKYAQSSTALPVRHTKKSAQMLDVMLVKKVEDKTREAEELAKQVTPREKVPTYNKPPVRPAKTWPIKATRSHELGPHPKANKTSKVSSVPKAKTDSVKKNAAVDDVSKKSLSATACIQTDRHMNVQSQEGLNELNASDEKSECKMNAGDGDAQQCVTRKEKEDAPENETAVSSFCDKGTLRTGRTNDHHSAIKDTPILARSTATSKSATFAPDKKDQRSKNHRGRPKDDSLSCTSAAQSLRQDLESMPQNSKDACTKSAHAGSMTHDNDRPSRLPIPQRYFQLLQIESRLQSDGSQSDDTLDLLKTASWIRNGSSVGQTPYPLSSSESSICSTPTAVPYKRPFDPTDLTACSESRLMGDHKTASTSTPETSMNPVPSSQSSSRDVSVTNRNARENGRHSTDESPRLDTTASLRVHSSTGASGSYASTKDPNSQPLPKNDAPASEGKLPMDNSCSGQIEQPHVLKGQLDDLQIFLRFASWITNGTSASHTPYPLSPTESSACLITSTMLPAKQNDLKISTTCIGATVAGNDKIVDTSTSNTETSVDVASVRDRNAEGERQYASAEDSPMPDSTADLPTPIDLEGYPLLRKVSWFSNDSSAFHTPCPSPSRGLSHISIPTATLHALPDDKHLPIDRNDAPASMKKKSSKTSRRYSGQTEKLAPITTGEYPLLSCVSWFSNDSSVCHTPSTCPSRESLNASTPATNLPAMTDDVQMSTACHSSTPIDDHEKDGTSPSKTVVKRGAYINASDNCKSTTEKTKHCSGQTEALTPTAAGEYPLLRNVSWFSNDSSVSDTPVLSREQSNSSAPTAILLTKQDHSNDLRKTRSFVAEKSPLPESTPGLCNTGTGFIPSTAVKEPKAPLSQKTDKQLLKSRLPILQCCSRKITKIPPITDHLPEGTLLRTASLITNGSSAGHTPYPFPSIESSNCSTPTSQSQAKSDKFKVSTDCHKSIPEDGSRSVSSFTSKIPLRRGSNIQSSVIIGSVKDRNVKGNGRPVAQDEPKADFTSDLRLSMNMVESSIRSKELRPPLVPKNNKPPLQNSLSILQDCYGQIKKQFPVDGRQTDDRLLETAYWIRNGSSVGNTPYPFPSRESSACSTPITVITAKADEPMAAAADLNPRPKCAEKLASSTPGVSVKRLSRAESFVKNVFTTDRNSRRSSRSSAREPPKSCSSASTTTSHVGKTSCTVYTASPSASQRVGNTSGTYKMPHPPKSCLSNQRLSSDSRESNNSRASRLRSRRSAYAIPVSLSELQKALTLSATHDTTKGSANPGLEHSKSTFPSCPTVNYFDETPLTHTPPSNRSHVKIATPSVTSSVSPTSSARTITTPYTWPMTRERLKKYCVTPEEDIGECGTPSDYIVASGLSESVIDDEFQVSMSPYRNCRSPSIELDLHMSPESTISATSVFHAPANSRNF